MTKDLQWPPVGDTIRRINDIVHTSISVPRPLDSLIDTPEFQRLRNVKQLGAADMVFPSGNHSRFTHSLGTCYIAQLVLEKLKRDESLDITSEDVLCVTTAAMLHDIGHGPYSHMFDGAFLDALGKSGTWTHEAGSKEIIRRLFTRERVVNAFKPFLGGDDEARFQRNVDFIIECVSPPSPMMDNGTWIPRGRPINKSFLYDIVSNVHDGFDVDKFDYVLRDSLLSGFGIRFSMESLLRVVNNIRVLPCPTSGIKRICFAQKTADELLSLADSRHVLHARVYQHKTVRLIEALIVKALVAAEPYLQFHNHKGETFTLSTIMNDIDVFCTVDDSVLQMISHSTKPELDKARSYLRAIQHRDLAKRIIDIECSPSEQQIIGKGIDVGKKRHEICNTVTERLISCGKDFNVSKDDIFVLNRRIFPGLDGYKHPMSEVLVYDNKAANPVAKRLDAKWLDRRASRHTMVVSFALYLSSGITESQTELLKHEFELALKEYGIVAA